LCDTDSGTVLTALPCLTYHIFFPLPSTSPSLPPPYTPKAELFQKEATFKHKQQQELLALQKRIQSGREEQKKQRQLDLERLLQRYQNVKSELEAQQNIERLRSDKYPSSKKGGQK
jgi:hypothetical protein